MPDPQRLGDLLADERLLLTTEDAAELLRVGRTTIYGLIKAGELHPVHIGRSCRISRAELERYVHRLERPPVDLRGGSPGHRRTDTNQDGLFDVDAATGESGDRCGFRAPTRHRSGPHSAPPNGRPGEDHDRRR